MAIGMSYGEYWDGAPDLVKDYREAHEIRSELQNEQNWLLGMYVSQAVAAVLLGRQAPYPSEPYPLDTKIGRERKRRQQEVNELKVTDYLNTWAESVNQKIYAQQRKELEEKKREKAREEAEKNYPP